LLLLQLQLLLLLLHLVGIWRLGSLLVIRIDWVGGCLERILGHSGRGRGSGCQLLLLLLLRVACLLLPVAPPLLLLNRHLLLLCVATSYLLLHLLLRWLLRVVRGMSVRLGKLWVGRLPGVLRAVRASGHLRGRVAAARVLRTGLTPTVRGGGLAPVPGYLLACLLRVPASRLGGAPPSLCDGLRVLLPALRALLVQLLILPA